MRLRWLRRLRARVSCWPRRLARYTDVIFSVLQRHRAGVTLLCLALLVAVGCMRLLQTELGRNPYLGPVMLRLGKAPAWSLPAILIVGTGLQALILYTRRRLVLRLIAVAAFLCAGAEGICAFDKIFPEAPRALLGLLVLPSALVYAAIRGSLARIRRLLSVALLVVFCGILPVLFGRAASEDGPSRATEMAYFGGWAAIWALGLVAWITALVPNPHRRPTRLPAGKGPRAPLGGTRTLALVLLLPPYLSLDLASSVRTGGATLEAAHRMMIRSEVFTLFEKRLSDTAAGTQFEADGRQIVPGLGNLKATASCDTTCAFTVSLDSFTDTESFDFTFNGRDLARGLMGARIVLARLAIENGIRL
jgi:hypothetical protein